MHKRKKKRQTLSSSLDSLISTGIETCTSVDTSLFPQDGVSEDEDEDEGAVVAGAVVAGADGAALVVGGGAAGGRGGEGQRQGGQVRGKRKI